jgi:DNA polymerase-3 subunit beta
MLFQFDGHELTLVATDGHRLACRTIPVRFNKEKSIKTSIIVPRRAVLELIRLMDADQSFIRLSFNAQTAVFSFKDMQFVCKLIDGKYPDYKRVLPKELPFKVQVEKDEMKQALSQIQPFLSAKEKGFNLVFMDNQIEMKAQNSFNEIIKVSIPCSGAVPNMKIGFNLSYLNDFIASQKGKEFSISLKDDSVGVVFEDDLNGFYLVMPLRL